MEEKKEEKNIKIYPKSTSIDGTKTISEQMKNSICKIYTDNEANQIGFFCYIPYENKKISVLITNNNAINEKNIKKIKQLNYHYIMI